MSKLKICFLIHTLGGGGAEKALVNLVKSLPRERYDIHVKTVIDTGRYRSELPEHVHYSAVFSLPGIRRVEKEGESGSLLAKPSKIKLFIAKLYLLFWRTFGPKNLYRLARIPENGNVEIADLEGIATKIIAGSTNAESLKFAWVHVDLQEQKKSHDAYRSFEEECVVYGCYDRIVAVSNHVATVFEGLFSEIAPYTAVCHNILDEAELKQKSHLRYGDNSRECSLPFSIVSIGRLNWQKGYDRLIEAVARLRQEGFDFHLEIVGTGNAMHDLVAQIEQLGISEVVELKGYLDNPYEVLAKADLFVASSRTEGLSTVVAEALVLGIPVVATDCSGMAELLGDSEKGMIVPNSTEGLYDGLRVMLTDRETYGHYRDVARELSNPLSAERGVYEFEQLLSTGRNDA